MFFKILLYSSLLKYSEWGLRSSFLSEILGSKAVWFLGTVSVVGAKRDRIWKVLRVLFFNPVGTNGRSVPHGKSAVKSLCYITADLVTVKEEHHMLYPFKRLLHCADIRRGDFRMMSAAILLRS